MAIRKLSMRQQLDLARQTLDSGPSPIKRHSDGPVELLGHIPSWIEKEGPPAGEAQEAAALILDFVKVGSRKFEVIGTKSPLWWVPYAIGLVSSPSVLLALSESQRKQVRALLMELAREPGDEKRVPIPEVRAHIRQSALLALITPDIFQMLTKSEKVETAVFLFGADHDPGNALSLHAAMGHVFRHLPPPSQRELAHRVLLDAENRDTAGHNHVIGTKHIFLSLSPEARRRAVGFLFRGTERPNPWSAEEAIRALGKKHVFEFLGEDERHRVALIALDLARGKPHPPTRDIELKPVKSGMETLMKRAIFDALPPKTKKIAAMLFLAYLQEPGPWFSRGRHLAMQRILELDVTAGIRRRARRALAKDYILLALPPRDRSEASRLSKWKPPG